MLNYLGSRRGDVRFYLFCNFKLVFRLECADSFEGWLLLRCLFLWGLLHAFSGVKLNEGGEHGDQNSKLEEGSRHFGQDNYFIFD